MYHYVLPHHQIHSLQPLVSILAPRHRKWLIGEGVLWGPTYLAVAAPNQCRTNASPRHRFLPPNITTICHSHSPATPVASRSTSPTPNENGLRPDFAHRIIPASLQYGSKIERRAPTDEILDEVLHGRKFPISLLQQFTTKAQSNQFLVRKCFDWRNQYCAVFSLELFFDPRLLR